MTVCGTCKTCGGDTYDYVCLHCQREEIKQLQAEIERLRGALRFACTPPWQTHGAKLGVVDETLLNYYLRRAAEAAKEPTP